MERCQLTHWSSRWKLLRRWANPSRRRDDLINNHTCININSHRCNGLIIIGGVYFDTVIYATHFVMKIKQFCISKTTSSVVPAELTVEPITGLIFRQETRNKQAFECKFEMLGSLLSFRTMIIAQKNWDCTDNCALISHFVICPLVL